ncbi:MAG: amidohydrolase family protein [Myxococcales bacterium]
MSKMRIPGSREEDSWFSEEQLQHLESAEDDGLRSPVPTQMVSNGEYLPNPQTREQKRVEARILELAAEASKKLGVSRRQFLASSGGMAASFLAMNEAHGAEFFKVSREEMFEPEAHARNAPPSDLFVLDDQLHTIRSSLTGPGNALRDIAEGNHSGLNPTNLPDELGGVNTPWNPALKGLPNLNSNFWLPQFMKDVYLDSQVTIGIMSNNTSAAVPGITAPRAPKNITESEAGEFLSATQTASVRDWVNQIAGSTRMLGHGQLFPGVGNTQDPVYGDYHRWQIENLKPDSWKGYTSANSVKRDTNPDTLFTRWVLDEEVAYKTYELITSPQYYSYKAAHPGFYNICIHKGLSTNAPDDPSSEFAGYPTDIPPAAKDWPMLNFLIYHSCIRPGFWVRNALLDVQSGNVRAGGDGGPPVPDILWTTRFLVSSAPYRNVYSELGTTFASSVITFPTVCAHILGQGLRFFGEDRIVFGSDSVWYGAPQWQIEALWRFQIPDALRKKYAYPELTERAKRKIFGLNNARLYGIKNVDGRLTDESCGDDGHGRDDDHDNSHRGAYHPVPANYESLIPTSLKRVMEFPGFPKLTDNLSKMRNRYLASGARPDNTRYGWVRRS